MCIRDSTKKDATPGICLPAPLPKEAEESCEPSSDEPSKSPNASWSYNKLRQYCDRNGIKRWCEQQSIPIKANDKEDLLSKYKLWTHAKDKGEVVGEKTKRRQATSRRGKKDDNSKDASNGAPAQEAEDHQNRRKGARKNRKDESHHKPASPCLLYTSDAADDLLCVDLGGRRIIKKKKQ
eukprot:TRINITY_DN1213_c0_g1_i1.p1 TRINITY_DN1213_c0_g1~~TRINITY_DN1213_c0_g1_i1.p1  ORF type:complete len:180 (+),score=60.31 TRINITY_DN1213_c0_g1_i1:179-718(+)